MKETIGKAFSLGLGIMALGKEQIEKAVDELVKRGEVSKGESRELVADLVEKGQEAKDELDRIIRDKVNALRGELSPAVRNEITRLERRIDELERLVRPAAE